MVERVVPTIVALRLRFDEICQQELEGFRSEAGPFTAEQEEGVDRLDDADHLRISNQLARELKEREERSSKVRLARLPFRSCSTWKSSADRAYHHGVGVEAEDG